MKPIKGYLRLLPSLYCMLYIAVALEQSLDRRRSIAVYDGKALFIETE
ncbi:hypothetical protein KBI23_00905 [bacterium]|nr:hypothetical protein [bacterium]MBP9089555.1 hypothetical protein [bacterium]MBP9808935.1 hypothetical protein [bacterium]